MHWYLSGGMSGYPDNNFPVFREATNRLRSMGYSIVSPAELDEQESIVGKTWGDFLARDVKIVADEVTGIVFLPGWEKSRGARLEAFVGVLCGHVFGAYDSVRGITDLTTQYVRENLL